MENEPIRKTTILKKIKFTFPEESKDDVYESIRSYAETKQLRMQTIYEAKSQKSGTRNFPEPHLLLCFEYDYDKFHIARFRAGGEVYTSRDDQRIEIDRSNPYDSQSDTMDGLMYDEDISSY